MVASLTFFSDTWLIAGNSVPAVALDVLTDDMSALSLLHVTLHGSPGAPITFEVGEGFDLVRFFFAESCVYVSRILPNRKHTPIHA